MNSLVVEVSDAVSPHVSDDLVVGGGVLLGGLYVCVCVYICMYWQRRSCCCRRCTSSVCMYICMYVCMQARIVGNDVFNSSLWYVCICGICMHIYTPACVQTSKNAHENPMSNHAHTYTHIYTHTYTHIHTQPYTYTHNTYTYTYTNT
jgi:hypothetical protein